MCTLSSQQSRLLEELICYETPPCIRAWLGPRDASFEGFKASCYQMMIKSVFRAMPCAAMTLLKALLRHISSCWQRRHPRRLRPVAIFLSQKSGSNHAIHTPGLRLFSICNTSPWRRPVRARAFRPSSRSCLACSCLRLWT
jgi:hypothetical protein